MRLYKVIITDFAEKHYCKDLNKKHKKTWNITRQAIIDLLKNVNVTLLKTDRLKTITQKEVYTIAKGDFKIHGSKVSAKKSGYRFIVKINFKLSTCTVLLVYHKKHIKGSHETVWWKTMVKDFLV